MIYMRGDFLFEKKRTITAFVLLCSETVASSDSSVHLVQGQALGPQLPRAQCQHMFPNPRSCEPGTTQCWSGPGLQDFQVNQLLVARDHGASGYQACHQFTPHHCPQPVTMAETEVATTAPGDPP